MDPPKTHRLIFSLLLVITPGWDSKRGEICPLIMPRRRVVYAVVWDF
jgi:hypothetical protein